jgi:hypothetical protein
VHVKSDEQGRENGGKGLVKGDEKGRVKCDEKGVRKAVKTSTRKLVKGDGRDVDLLGAK